MGRSEIMCKCARCTLLFFLHVAIWSFKFGLIWGETLNICNCSIELFVYNSSSDKMVHQSKNTLPPIVYIKTHKTGSETSANIMHRMADIRNLEGMIPLPPSSRVKLGWPAPFPGTANSHYPPSSMDIISDHLVFNKRAIEFYMKPNPFIWSTIRDTVSQAISSFNYFYVYTTQVNFTWDTHLDWIEAQDKVLSKKAARFCNSMALDFGWYDRVPLRMRINDHDHVKINQFIAELDNALDLLVPLDVYDQGLILLSYMLNVSYHEMVYLHQNSGTSTPVLPDEEQRSRIEHVLSVDHAIYSHFAQRFHEQWKEASTEVAEAYAHDNTIELLDERLRKLQLLNTELQALCSLDPPDSRCGEHFKADSASYNAFLLKKNDIARYVVSKATSNP